MHVLSECKKMAQTEYKKPHDIVATWTQWRLCQILQTDASNAGVDAVLMQEHDGEFFPVSYASKNLSEREKQYATIERECLALVWAVKKFQMYLYGRRFTLQTDH